MLGNDIIDLALAQRQSNWRRKNFLFKIFSAEERTMVYNAKNPDTMVWRIWSMKEAAYKIVNRQTKIRVYNPWDYHCTVESGSNVADGIVQIKHQQFRCNTEISPSYIHTVALPMDKHPTNVVIHCSTNRKDYRERFNAAYPTMRLSNGLDSLPMILDLQTNHARSASVSHHGEYLAVVYDAE